MANYNATGRPTKLTPELQDRFCELMLAGNYVSTTCEILGVDTSSIKNWFDRADDPREGNPIYLEFFLAVKKSEAQAEARLLSKIEAAGNDPKNWPAHMTILERRHPERWGRRDRVQVDQKTTIVYEIETVHQLDGTTEEQRVLEAPKQIPEHT